MEMTPMLILLISEKLQGLVNPMLELSKAIYEIAEKSRQAGQSPLFKAISTVEQLAENFKETFFKRYIQRFNWTYTDSALFISICSCQKNVAVLSRVESAFLLLEYSQK